MPYLGYEQIVASAVSKGRAALTIPSGTTRIVVQADTNDVRYLMIPEANSSLVPTQTVGMIFIVGNLPEEFSIDDFIHITFVRGAGTDGNLNIHYYTARIIP